MSRCYGLLANLLWLILDLLMVVHGLKKEFRFPFFLDLIIILFNDWFDKLDKIFNMIFDNSIIEVKYVLDLFFILEAM